MVLGANLSNEDSLQNPFSTMQISEASEPSSTLKFDLSRLQTIIARVQNVSDD